MGREIGSVRPVWKPKNSPAERRQRMLTRKCPVPEDWTAGKACLDARWPRQVTQGRSRRKCGAWPYTEPGLRTVQAKRPQWWRQQRVLRRKSDRTQRGEKNNRRHKLYICIFFPGKTHQKKGRGRGSHVLPTPRAVSVDLHPSSHFSALLCPFFPTIIFPEQFQLDYGIRRQIGSCRLDKKQKDSRHALKISSARGT